MISQAPVDQADLIAGYQRASSIKPVKAEDLNKVYSEYGLAAGQTRGKSDAQLQQRAAKAVVDWWNRQQVKAPAEPPAGAAAKPPATTVAAKPPAKPAAGAGQATAVNVMNTAALLREGGGQTTAPKPLTPAQSDSILKASGMVGAAPPSYALVNAQTLAAWIARVKYNRALIAKKPSVAQAIAERKPAPAARPIPHGALAANNL